MTMWIEPLYFAGDEARRSRHPRGQHRGGWQPIANPSLLAEAALKATTPDGLIHGSARPLNRRRYSSALDGSTVAVDDAVEAMALCCSMVSCSGYDIMVKLKTVVPRLRERLMFR
jgi:hypothetical protein